MTESRWEKKEGLFEYSIKRLSSSERLVALERIQQKIPMTEELKTFMQLT